MSLIYVADDEPNIRNIVSIGLKDSGFETEEFADGTSLLNEVRRKRPDAIVLDWMMPQPDGLTVCRILRENEETHSVPILMLTARGEEIDRVLGLEIGADDYIVKPFSIKELCARVKAVLRRTGRREEPRDEVFRHGSLVVDVLRHQVSRDGRPIDLTAKEFDLLVMLMKNRGRVMTRDSLLDKVWGVEYFGDTRTVDVHVRYLRQKIEEDPDSPVCIQTVRGVGYRFSED
ncbi:Sensory transduction protein regX3 [Caprobacter fermentans]|uniref:Stage 0 sporulation protein A homolog n=1 Tax=Caproicibacter fermentans TaxID=2576756 RepID=A0A6N8I076_9FIRM|nr:response regulator transcription factor [Caproicibacter fermentans]MVB11544.1 Sensory transduction protein regX3 [Caproicibacter fermentans]OCN02738.1 DNA-binding response regulator [Clostridium sp. W14A]QNK41060.1 response regulator transcription factor [Caproicibacter fermentans]